MGSGGEGWVGGCGEEIQPAQAWVDHDGVTAALASVMVCVGADETAFSLD